MRRVDLREATHGLSEPDYYERDKLQKKDETNFD